MAFMIQKYFNGNIVATSCANMIKISPVTPEIVRVTTALFGRASKNQHMPPNYLDSY